MTAPRRLNYAGEGFLFSGLPHLCCPCSRVCVAANTRDANAGGVSPDLRRQARHRRQFAASPVPPGFSRTASRCPAIAPTPRLYVLARLARNPGARESTQFVLRSPP